MCSDVIMIFLLVFNDAQFSDFLHYVCVLQICIAELLIFVSIALLRFDEGIIGRKKEWRGKCKFVKKCPSII